MQVLQPSMGDSAVHCSCRQHASNVAVTLSVESAWSIACPHNHAHTACLLSVFCVSPSKIWLAAFRPASLQWVASGLKASSALYKQQLAQIVTSEVEAREVTSQAIRTQLCRLRPAANQGMRGTCCVGAVELSLPRIPLQVLKGVLLTVPCLLQSCIN